MSDEILLPGEQGAADDFVATCGYAFRYLPHWRKYATWDGKRWDTDAGDTILRGLWQEYLRNSVRAVLDAGETAKAGLKAIAKKSDARYERDMVALCQARTRADYRDFDADPYVLNCANGILDLRTLELRDHDPGALCTRLAPVDWDPNADCPKWRAYLKWAMQDDADRVAYLQRFFGLCLTGDAEHELAHFFWGEGGNGKTTVVKTIEGILGDYARRAPARLLMYRKHEPHPTELAGLCGRRLVVLAETNENQTIDEQQVKLVASKDSISARRMREDFWDFAPTHKAILLTNNKPRVRGQDEGIWRRIVLVEWGARVAEADKDPHYADRFQPERPGILRWAVEGLQAIQGNDLRPPESVRRTSAEYRSSEDSLARWIETECVRDPKAVTAVSDLYTAYSRFAEQCNESRLTPAAFGRRLTACGFVESVPRTAQRKRVGIKLRWQQPIPFRRPEPVAATGG